MRARVPKSAVTGARDFAVIFCIVFSFYVVAFIQSSFIIGGICMCCVLNNNKKTRELLIMLGDKDCFLIILFPLIIIMNSLISAASHVSLDINYAKNMLSLFVKMYAVVQIDAFTHGKPVISTNIPRSGVPEVNTDGVTGFTVEVNNPKAIADKISDLTGTSDIIKDIE